MKPYMNVVVLVPLEVEIDENHKVVSVAAPTVERVQAGIDSHGAFATENEARGYLMEARELFSRRRHTP